MRKRLTLIGTACCLMGCGSSATSNPKSSSGEGTDESLESSESHDGAPSKKKRSEMSGWSEVPPTESSHSGSGNSNRKGRVVVTSHPTKHGDALHFRFVVNSVPTSGVFSAPGGQTSTFTIPVGTVLYTVDECEGEPQGFELGADENMPISCELTKEGDCCDVAIPVEKKSKK